MLEIKATRLDNRILVDLKQSLCQPIALIKNNQIMTASLLLEPLVVTAFHVTLLSLSDDLSLLSLQLLRIVHFHVQRRGKRSTLDVKSPTPVSDLQYLEFAKRVSQVLSIRMDLHSSCLIAILLLEILLHLLELTLITIVDVTRRAVLPPRVSSFEQRVAILQDFRVGMLPIRLHDLDPPDSIQFQSRSAHEIGHVPLLHRLLIIEMLKLLYFALDCSVDLIKSRVDFCLEGVGEALHVGIIHHIIFQILEDHLHLLRQLFVYLLGLVLQVHELLFLALDFVVFLVDNLLLAEDLVLGVEVGSCEAEERDRAAPDGLLVVAEQVRVFLLKFGVRTQRGF